MNQFWQGIWYRIWRLFSPILSFTKSFFQSRRRYDPNDILRYWLISDPIEIEDGASLTDKHNRIGDPPAIKYAKKVDFINSIFQTNINKWRKKVCKEGLTITSFVKSNLCFFLLRGYKCTPDMECRPVTSPMSPAPNLETVVLIICYVTLLFCLVVGVVQLKFGPNRNKPKESYKSINSILSTTNFGFWIYVGVEWVDPNFKDGYLIICSLLVAIFILIFTTRYTSGIDCGLSDGFLGLAGHIAYVHQGSPPAWLAMLDSKSYFWLIIMTCLLIKVNKNSSEVTEIVSDIKIYVTGGTDVNVPVVPNAGNVPLVADVAPAAVLDGANDENTNIAALVPPKDAAIAPAGNEGNLHAQDWGYNV